MANSALIRGARDIARAKFIDPYKFSAWIRSMWYGLDKLDDRRYAERMAQLSSAAKIQENKRKQIENVNKLYKTDLEEHNAAFNVAIEGMFPRHQEDLKPWFDSLEQNYLFNTQVKNQYGPQSKEWRVADQNQGKIVTSLNNISGKYKEYLEHYGQLFPALNNGDLSGSNFRNTVLYQNMINTQHNRIDIVKNLNGEDALAFFFDNPHEEATNFLPEFDIDEEGNMRYGVLWGDYKNSPAFNFNLKNKGKGDDINVVYNNLRQKVQNGIPKDMGKFSGMFQRDKLTNELRIATPEEFLTYGINAYDNMISSPSIIKSGPQKGEKYNTDVYTNYQALANDYDLDGAGGTMLEYAASTQAMAIQPYYMVWLANQKNHPTYKAKWSAYGKGITTKKEFYQHMKNAPLWVNDRDFAEGYIELADINGISLYDIDINGPDDPTLPETLGGKVVTRPKGFKARLTKEFAGEDLLRNALSLYYAEGTYEALYDDADAYVKLKRKEDLAKAEKSGEEDDTLTGANLMYMNTMKSTSRLVDNWESNKIANITGDIGMEELTRRNNEYLANQLRLITGRGIVTAKDAWLKYAGLLSSGANKKFGDLKSEDIVEDGRTDEWKAYVDQSEEVKKALKADVNYTVPKKPLAFKNWIENKGLNYQRNKDGLLEYQKNIDKWNEIDVTRINAALKNKNIQTLNDAVVDIIALKKGKSDIGYDINIIEESESMKNFVQDIQDWIDKRNQNR